MSARSSFYARTEHGGYPVHLLGSQGFKVDWPHGPKTYPSAGQAIRALVNNTPEPDKGAYDPKIGFDRYFRQGRYAREADPPEGDDIVSLLQLDPPGQVTITAPKVQVVPDPVLTVHVRTDLGVDLKRRGIEVRKLFYATTARKVLARGYDPEDVLQEVYKGILVRNDGACPFDPVKSSFAHYVCMVIECIWSNYKRRYGRLDRNETFGSTDADGKEIDVAEADLQSVNADQDQQVGGQKAVRKLQEAALRQAAREGRDTKLLQGCLESLAVGLRPKEIALELGCDQKEVASTIAFLRKVGTRAGLHK